MKQLSVVSLCSHSYPGRHGDPCIYQRCYLQKQQVELIQNQISNLQANYATRDHLTEKSACNNPRSHPWVLNLLNISISIRSTTSRSNYVTREHLTEKSACNNPRSHPWVLNLLNISISIRSITSRSNYVTPDHLTEKSARNNPSESAPESYSYLISPPVLDQQPSGSNYVSRVRSSHVTILGVTPESYSYLISRQALASSLPLPSHWD